VQCDIFDKNGRMVPREGEFMTLQAIQELDEDTLPAELLAYKRACQAEEDFRARVSSEFWATVCAALALFTVGALIVKGPALMESAVKYFTGQ